MPFAGKQISVPSDSLGKSGRDGLTPIGDQQKMLSLAPPCCRGACGNLL
jgi:hypothetical protein